MGQRAQGGGQEWRRPWCTANTAAVYSNEPAARAARTLKNTCLAMLSRLGEAAVDAQALARFKAGAYTRSLLSST
jgi:hypothetical protein